MDSMFGIIFIIVFLILGAAILTGLIIWQRQPNRSTTISRRVLGLGSLVYAVIIVVIGLALPNAVQPTQSAAAQSATGGHQATSVNAKDGQSAGQLLRTMTATERQKYNHALATSLNENHDFAAAGDQGYDYAVYLEKLAYQQGRLVVNVTGDFTHLSQKQKQRVARSAQNMAATELTMLGKTLATGSYQLKTTVQYAGETIGQSQAPHTSQFSWNKN